MRIVGRLVQSYLLRQDVGEDSVNAVAIVGGTEKSLASKSFKGGKVKTVMGGLELDLRECEIVDPPVELNVQIWLGGADIHLPPHWKVQVDATAVMGGIEHPYDEKEELTPDLVITGKVALGGLEFTSQTESHLVCRPPRLRHRSKANGSLPDRSFAHATAR